ncbi:glycosyltransferase family 4 protein [Paenibacillus farraposensis]|uniref:Glycosyltransferase family 4 protein n=1 Tax=Paenibacillus farraposensis TaxID=2807095 RepID=A0ABW4DDD2_9BACL|nr:glycosyltransferase family 4 protein [Paenibacillus farraposensis]MCC3378658.1 glycosyltransferase family 4 protein [Paenibacillus farraposensis]
MLFSHVSNVRSITGAEKLLLHFCLDMRTYFDCILVTPDEGRLTTIARKRGITVQIQNLFMLHGMYTPYEGLAQDAENLRNHVVYAPLLQMLQQARPDVVLVNTCVNVMPAMAARELNIPVIWKITEVINQNEHTPVSVSIIERYTQWVIGISHAVMRPLLGGGLTRPHTVLPPCRDMDMPSPRQYALERKRKREKLGLRNFHICIGYISSFINEAKGLLPFVQMALKLCETNSRCRFWIIGSSVDSEYYVKCVSLIRQSGYSRRFQFNSFEESVSIAYGAMDIVVIPSMVEEGFGLTALEGLIYGRPVVAFAQGGLVELMESTGNTDFLVEPGNSDMLAQKVSYLLDHPEEVERIGVRNNSAAMRVYGPDSYRSNLHVMVSQWVCHHPHWFPLIQQPGGPVWTREKEGLRQVIAVPKAYTSIIREFPASVVCQLPVLGLPPIEYAAIQGLPQPVPPLPESQPESRHGERRIRARRPEGRRHPRPRNRRRYKVSRDSGRSRRKSNYGLRMSRGQHPKSRSRQKLKRKFKLRSRRRKWSRVTLKAGRHTRQRSG